jgi:hypothetical protein
MDKYHVRVFYQIRFKISLIQQTTNMASSDRFVAVGEKEIIYIISNIFAKPQVFYYLVSDAKIFDMIYQLSPLLECDPTVEIFLSYCFENLRLGIPSTHTYIPLIGVGHGMNNKIH